MPYHTNGNDIKTNLHTRGGEYVCSNNTMYPGCNKGKNGTYVGPMHYHPEKGYMAGATHSSISHPKLISLSSAKKGGRIRIRCNIDIISY